MLGWLDWGFRESFDWDHPGAGHFVGWCEVAFLIASGPLVRAERAPLNVMELRHLRYFVAVAEEGSIARAAVRLHVSEPPLSRQVRDLEGELGVALLERGPRAVRLTEAGRRFLPEARAALARVGQAVASVNARRGAAPPTLRLGVLGPGHLPRLRRHLERVRLAWPGVRLDFDHAPAGPLLERLAKGQLDAACVNLPLPPAAQARVDRGEWGCRPVYRGRLLAVLPAAHPLAAGGRRRVALAAEEFVLPGGVGRPDLGEIIVGACRGAGFEPRVGRWLEGPLSELVAAVAVGPGVSVLPDSLRCVRLPGAVYRALAPPVPVIPYALVWPEGTLAVKGSGPLRTLVGRG